MTWQDIRRIVQIADEIRKSPEFCRTEEGYYKEILNRYDKEKGGANASIDAALQSLRELGFKPRWNPEQKSLTFYYFGNKCTFFPKKGYYNGKGLMPGFGLDSLLEQLKETSLNPGQGHKHPQPQGGEHLL